VAGEQRLAPGSDLGNPLVENQHRRDAAQGEDEQAESDEALRRYAELGDAELVEREPSANIDKAGAIQDEVDDGGKHFVLDLVIEMPIP
jgi:hypothetical protein